MREIRRVLGNKKVIWTVILLFCIQSAVLLYSGKGMICETGTVHEFVTEYKKQYQKVKEIWDIEGENGVLQWMEQQKKQINDMMQSEYAYIRSIFILEEQVNAVSGYSEYLEYVKENSEKMQQSALNRSTYLQREIQKTQNDYQAMENVQVEFGEELAFRELFSEKSFSYSLLVIPAMICNLFLEERKKGLWKLLYSTPGYRKKYGRVRFFILLFGTGMITLFLCLWRIFLCGKLYGGYGDLTRSIQSISLCKEVTVRASVGTFFLFWTAWNVIGICFWGILIWNLFILFDTISISVGVFVAFCVVERYFYLSFPDYSKWRILRYLNIFTLIEPRQTMFHYLNVNCFGKPILIQIVLFACCGLGGMILAWVGMVVQNRKMLIQKRQNLFAQNHFFKRVSRIAIKQNLFFQEAYKLFITQKGLLIIGVLIIVQMNFIASPPVPSGSEDALREHFYRVYEGEVTNQKIQLMEEELSKMQETVENVDGSAQLSNELVRKQVDVLSKIIEECKARYENGEQIWLFPQNFYRALINSNNLENHTRLLTVECMLFLSLLLPSVFSVENENNMVKLTMSYYYGKGRRNKLRHYKWIWILLYEIIVFAILYGRELLFAYQLYGKPAYFSMDVQNLYWLTNKLPAMSIGLFLGGVYFLKFIFVLLCGSLMSFVGSKCKSVKLAQILSVTLIVLPGIFYLLGVEIGPFGIIWKWIGVCELL
jgi:hypothetical protein